MAQSKISHASAFSEVFDFNVSNTLADPLSCSRLASAQENLRAGLGEHCLSFASVSKLHLAAALKTEDDSGIRLAALGQRQGKCRQRFQAGELVHDHPDRPQDFFACRLC